MRICDFCGKKEDPPTICMRRVEYKLVDRDASPVPPGFELYLGNQKLDLCENCLNLLQVGMGKVLTDLVTQTRES